MTPVLRPELRDLPDRLRRLPLDKRGYPVPAFVQWMNGEPDFRFMSQQHWLRCVRERACWVCGDRLGKHLAFVIGPMCGITRTTSEPPCHRDCAIWSARFCPFLTRPRMVRREDELTRANQENIAGCMIDRNPGVALVWITPDYKVWTDDKGAPLITVGSPLETLWFREGRSATRAEIEESVRTGLPYLERMAHEDPKPGALEELHARVAEFRRLLPKE